MPIDVVLASRSPSRLQTLRGAGIEPTVHIADVDETAILATVANKPFDERVQALAQAKAQSVAQQIAPSVTRPTIVIGCDSMFVFDGNLWGKPHTPEVAIDRITLMSGKPGILLTGHHIVYFATTNDYRQARHMTDVSRATVYLGELDAKEIEAYVATGEPLDVAGSFTLEGYGGAFIDKIEGDHHGVIGVSLPLLRTMTKKLGIFWPDLWTERSDDYGG